ncbi:MAG: DUF3990 domain-containing protein [Thermoplasmata archaeon]|nr:DUF3990 domain-containing protein [Thermoplasmata archaeon]
MSLFQLFSRKVYHGSPTNVTNPQSDFNKDSWNEFGPGFYTTEDYKYSLIRGTWKTEDGKPFFVNHYLFLEECVEKYHLAVKTFNLDEEWLQYLIDSYYGRAARYDIVIGPTADDTVRNLLMEYIVNYPHGDYEQFSILLETLKKYVKSTQIQFQTQRAIEKCLKYVGADEIYDVQ